MVSQVVGLVMDHFKNMKKSIYILVTVLIGLLLFYLYLLYQNRHPKVKTTIVEKIDTIYVSKHDTLFKENYYQLPSVIDTFIVFKENRDTLYIHGMALDTINVDSLRLELAGSETIIRDSIFITEKTTVESVFSFDLGVVFLPSINGVKNFDIGLKTALNFKGNSVDLGYNFLKRQITIGYRRRIIDIKK